MKNVTLKNVINFIITVLTAIASAFFRRRELRSYLLFPSLPLKLKSINI